MPSASHMHACALLAQLYAFPYHIILYTHVYAIKRVLMKEFPPVASHEHPQIPPGISTISQIF
jgi:hypothetical protein